MSKGKKITLFSILGLFTVLAVFVICWYFGDNYTEFYKLSRKEFEIAGLSDGFTPQGMCYEENAGVFLYSGYMNNGSASRIYVYNTQNADEQKFITLKYADESAYVGHAGGIDTDGYNVWIAGDKKLCRVSVESILSAENGSAVQIIDEREMPNGADFLKYESGRLWVGEFHKDGKYDTDESHHIETVKGKTNKALSFCFEINQTLACAIEQTPIAALSTNSLVQGMEIYGNKCFGQHKFNFRFGSSLHERRNCYCKRQSLHLV